VFGYSDEDGTVAAGLPDKIDPTRVAERVERLTVLVEELTAQRAEDRVGDVVTVLVESPDDDSADPRADGRAAHQGPEVDGSTSLVGGSWPVGALVPAVVVGSSGVDLVAAAHTGNGRPDGADA